MSEEKEKVTKGGERQVQQERQTTQERPVQPAQDEAERQRAFQTRTNQAIQVVMSALEPLNPEQQRRVLSAVATLYGIGSQRPNQQRQQQQRTGNGGR